MRSTECRSRFFYIFTPESAFLSIFTQLRHVRPGSDAGPLGANYGTDTGKQDIDTDVVTADISRPRNGFTMLQRVINWRIYYYYYYYLGDRKGIRSVKKNRVSVCWWR